MAKPRWRTDRKTWSVVFNDPLTGNRRQATFHDEADAWAFYSRAKTDREALRAGTLTHQQVTVGARGMTDIVDVISIYRKGMESSGTSDKHIKQSIQVVANAVKAHKWTMPKQINGENVNKYLSGFSPSTANSYLRKLRAFSKWLCQSCYVPQDPLAHIKGRKNDVLISPARALTMGELQKLTTCKLIKPWRRLWYTVGAGMGLRNTEIPRLLWGDFDLDRGILKMAGGRTKNGKPANLPVPDRIVALLRPEQQHPLTKVFRHKIDTNVWKRDLVRAGIDHKMEAGYAHRHSLRKTYGTQLVASGVPLATAVKLMRHSDPKLTMNLYVDAEILDLKGLANKAMGAIN